MTKKSAYRFPYLSPLAKGNWYWEKQVGPVVLMWKHDTTHKPTNKFVVGRFVAWYDSAWAWEVKRPLRQLRRRFR